jgi:hypothetical protein
MAQHNGSLSFEDGDARVRFGALASNETAGAVFVSVDVNGLSWSGYASPADLRAFARILYKVAAEANAQVEV